ncbi:hypothetical protein TNCT_94251, partial [Trichonephila clavata]
MRKYSKSGGIHGRTKLGFFHESMLSKDRSCSCPAEKADRQIELFSINTNG